MIRFFYCCCCCCLFYNIPSLFSLSLSLSIYIYMYKTTVSSVHSGRLVLAVAAITTTITINKMRKHVLMITKDLSLMKQGK